MTRYVMVGGFLGAGKTTAMLRFGPHLRTRADASGSSPTIRARGWSTRRSVGERISRRGNHRRVLLLPVQVVDGRRGTVTARTTPDVFLADPVGNCTDLRATVSDPFSRMYGDTYSVAPFSVLVDPARRCGCSESEQGVVFRQGAVRLRKTARGS